MGILEIFLDPFGLQQGCLLDEVDISVQMFKDFDDPLLALLPPVLRLMGRIELR